MVCRPARVARIVKISDDNEKESSTNNVNTEEVFIKDKVEAQIDGEAQNNSELIIANGAAADRIERQENIVDDQDQAEGESSTPEHLEKKSRNAEDSPSILLSLKSQGRKVSRIEDIPPVTGDVKENLFHVQKDELPSKDRKE